MKKISEKDNIRFGIILSYISVALSMIGAFFITNRIVINIGDYNYGLYGFVNSITSWLTILSAALNASFVKYSTIEASDNNGDSSKINTIYLKLFTYLGITILVLGLSIVGILYFNRINFIKYNWEDSKEIYLLFMLSIINISITMPTTLFSLYISYKKKFVCSKLIAIFVIIINLGGQFLIAYYTKSIICIAIYTIIVTIITWVINFYFAYVHYGIKFCKTNLLENRKVVRSIVIFSGILVLNSIVNQVNMSASKTILGLYSTPEDITTYELGGYFYTCFEIVSSSITGVFIPQIYSLVVENNRKEVNNLFLKVSKMQIFVLCLVSFGYLSCGREFVTLWMGDGREMIYYVGATLLIIEICPLTLDISVEIQRALNKHKFRTIVYFLTAVFNIVLSIVLIRIMPNDSKILACLMGTTISVLISHWIIMNIYNMKIIKLPIEEYLLSLFKYIVFGLIAFFITKLFVIQNNSVIIMFVLKGFTFVIIYMILIWLLDKNFIIQLLKDVFEKEKKDK